MRRFIPLLVGALLLAMVMPGVAAAKNPASPVTVPITGTYAGGTVAGAFEITRFASQNGQIVALGTLTATVTDAAGASAPSRRASPCRSRISCSAPRATSCI